MIPMPKVVTRAEMVGQRVRRFSGWHLAFVVLALWEFVLAAWGCGMASPWFILNGLLGLVFAVVAALVRPGLHCSICGNRILKTSNLCPTCGVRIE